MGVSGNATFAGVVTTQTASVSSGGASLVAYGYDGAALLYTTRAESNFNTALYLYNNPTSGAGTGTGIMFRARSSTTDGQQQATIYSSWTTNTHASRTAKLVFQTANSGVVADKLTIEGNGDATFAGAIIQSMSNPYTKMIDTSSGGDTYGLNNNQSKFSIYNWTDGREELYFGGDGNAVFTGGISVHGNSTIGNNFADAHIINGSTTIRSTNTSTVAVLDVTRGDANNEASPLVTSKTATVEVLVDRIVVLPFIV